MIGKAFVFPAQAVKVGCVFYADHFPNLVVGVKAGRHQGESVFHAVPIEEIRHRHARSFLKSAAHVFLREIEILFQNRSQILVHMLGGGQEGDEAGKPLAFRLALLLE